MSGPNKALGDPALRSLYGRARGLVAFVDESYRSPTADRQGFYSATGALIDRDRMVDVRRALLKVTGGKPWHTTEAHRLTPAVIERMTVAIALEAYNNTLVVSTPWSEGSVVQRRAETLKVLMRDMSRQGARLVVLDSMEPVERERDQRIATALRSAGDIDRTCRIAHADDSVESLLWVPDTVGWAVGRLISYEETQWTDHLEDVVAVKESIRGGWVDLSAVREAAGKQGAHRQLNAQVAAMRSAAFPTGEQRHPTRRAQQPPRRSPVQGRNDEGPTR